MNGAPSSTAVIVLNYNGADVLGDCLRHLLDQDRAPSEIIVVDNCSADRSRQIVREHFPTVRLLELDRNHMFAGGNNIGLQNTECDFVAFLNNDCFAGPGWLSGMLGRMTEGVGAVACSMRMLDRPDLVDSAGGTVDELGHTMDRGFGKPASGFEERCDVFFPCGGAFLLRRSALEGLLLFWEDLDIYGEDADLGWRLWRTGWRVVYEPGATAVHHHSHTLGRTPGKKERLLARNRVMLLRRHLTRKRFGRLLPWLLLWQSARVLKNLALLRPVLAWALLSGMTAGLLRPVEKLRLRRNAASVLGRFLPEESPGGGVSGFVRRRARRALLL